MKVVREDAGRQFPQETLEKASDRVRVPVFVGAYKINVPFYVQNETLKISIRRAIALFGSYPY